MRKKILYELGIMQGRLLPKYKNRFQAFPKYSWSFEFNIAKKLGFKFIEFIFDYEDFIENPLLSKKGLKKIQFLEKIYKIKVRSICADFFMEKPIYEEGISCLTNKIILRNLIKNCKKVGIKEIIIPCVDKSSLDTTIKIKKAKIFLKSLKYYLKKNDTNLTLETDLSPTKFSNFINEIRSKNIKINYDIGNSASLGYNPIIEFKRYGHLITNIHIKDRQLNGPSCELGEGGANFELIFKLLKNIKEKLIILQMFRDDEGISILKKQLKFLRDKFDG